MIKDVIRKLLYAAGYPIWKDFIFGPLYKQDGLYSAHNHDFMNEPSFRRAYARGVRAAGTDYRIHWRIHVALWAAGMAGTLQGDFVECGVNRGFISSAIMEHLDWDSLGKTFYLLDTFCGIDERFLTPEEREQNLTEKNKKQLESGFYTTDLECVKENFSQWRNVKIIQGPVPETLEEVQAPRIAFLHIDMNNVVPEIAAFNYFWPCLVPGSCVLFDDYGWRGGGLQKPAIDEAVAAVKANVLALPTGQGLVIKPGSRSREVT